MIYGTSSPPFGGQQRFRRDAVIRHPVRNPCFSKAAIAYSEQDGSNRHAWRSLVGATR